LADLITVAAIFDVYFAMDARRRFERSAAAGRIEAIEAAARAWARLRSTTPAPSAIAAVLVPQTADAATWVARAVSWCRRSRASSRRRRALSLRNDRISRLNDRACRSDRVGFAWTERCRIRSPDRDLIFLVRATGSISSNVSSRWRASDISAARLRAAT